MKLGVVTARGGSKRIPGKNIKDFCGKPIIGWSIETLHQTKFFDRVIVSTDCDKIAAVAREYGAEVPFVRPEELANDFAPTQPVIKHAAEEMARLSGEVVELVCSIYPTAPFARAENILKGFDILATQPEVDCVFPIATSPFSVQRALRIDSGKIEMLHPEFELTRSQDLIEGYFDTGQFYCMRGPAASVNTSMFTNAQGMVISRKEVVDIDTLEDWDLGETLFKVIKRDQ